MLGAAALAVAGTFAPARAHHRQTPPIVQVTTDGDAEWPRIPSLGDRIAYAKNTGHGHQIFQRQRDRRSWLQLTNQGDNANPTVAIPNSILAWDSDANFLNEPGFSGRHVYLQQQGMRIDVGPGANPSLNGPGTRLAFERGGQVLYWTFDGSIVQVSNGRGVSRNPAYGRGGSRLVFESTSDPATGDDTGVSQIWVALPGAPPAPITNGHGSSTLPTISPAGRLVGFVSTAALADDGHDTGVPQIFVYDVTTNVRRQITNEPGGCTKPSLTDMVHDWRVVYVCGGQGYYTDITKVAGTEPTFALAIADGDTSGALDEGGNFFVQVSTTSSLMSPSSPPTAGHQLYQVNLFKKPGSLKRVGGVRTF